MEIVSFKNLVREKFPLLSAGQKKVANYLFENLDNSVFKTAFQIGKEAEVSETTVIRLSYALGFEGFSKMQAKIQKELLRQNHTELVYRDESLGLDVDNDPFTKQIEHGVHILRNLLNHENVQEIWKTVDKLIQADQIIIVGHRISFSAAYWFSYSLSCLRENVNLCTTAGDFFEKFCNLTNKSVVVVFSFPRYANETIRIANCAKEQGIYLISVTDRLLSPVGSISDITLTTEENVETGINSTAPVISLLDLIITGIFEKDKKRIQVHQQKLENLYSSYEVFNE
ncbi:MurR/RpiR family transcriptional regulator [Bacillus sp. RG28]|uniref:MurR/RpiR family transcriptional regulator n=1 Tax=Gottfriedia endophytica TaxID=2820819 RepID=A0A940NJH7_9BACI|nr:MurR/RpiR family transcriptional regulator [Gottfriedia endophytica]MBP0726459.1 MurR/RpiR family transcriptional regulator [Gottfriedia endophytica]